MTTQFDPNAFVAQFEPQPSVGSGTQIATEVPGALPGSPPLEVAPGASVPTLGGLAGGLLTGVEDWFTRGFLIIIGLLILAFGLWHLLGTTGTSGYIAALRGATTEGS